MKYKLDHDYHIHSKLSLCSNDKEQTKENIFKYAEFNGFDKICITDHFWSDLVDGANDWYKKQNFSHISEIFPLPQSEKTKFYFGCETEMDKFYNIGISDGDMEKFDFIIIPTTHLHMDSFTISSENFSLEKRAELYIKRFEKLLEKDLPFEKTGIAHLSCPLMAPKNFDDHIKVMSMLEESALRNIMKKASKVGLGIELNLNFKSYNAEQLEIIMAPYKIAKEENCKFYFGSDAHHTKELAEAKENFEKISNYLNLSEDDKFCPFC